jgi:hypothetical protein
MHFLRWIFRATGWDRIYEGPLRPPVVGYSSFLGVIGDCPAFPRKPAGRDAGDK